MKPLYRYTWFKVVTGLVILCLLFISFLPYAIRYGIEQWYLKQGADFAQLEDVDLNLFTGKLQLDKLTVSKNNSPLLDISQIIIDFDWLPLFEKRAFFPQLTISGLKTGITQLQDGNIKLAGITLPENNNKSTENEPLTWGFGLQHISINNTVLTIKTPVQSAEFGIDEITLDHIESWSQDNSQLNFTGKINQSTVNLSGQFNVFSDQPSFDGTISVVALDLAPAAIHLKDQLQSLKGSLDLHSRFNVKLTPGKQSIINTDLDIGINNLHAIQTDGEASLDKLNLQGKLNFNLSAQQTLTDLLLQGQLKTENVVYIARKKHHYHHDKLNWNGDIKIRQENTLQTLINGQINAAGITFKDQDNQQQLLFTEKLAIDNFSVSNLVNLDSKNISLENLRVLYKPEAKKSRQKPALLQSTLLTIDSAALEKGSNIKLGNILFKNALIHINRQKDGRLQQLALLQSTNKPTAEKKPVAKPTGNSDEIKISVNKIAIGKNSKIRIIDKTVTPEFKTEWNINTAQLQHVNSAKKDSASPFKLDANLDKYSTITINGNILPFSDKLSLTLKGKLSNINLPPLSSYTSGVIGYNLHSGQLDADLDLNINKGKIKANNQLKLSNLKVKPSDPEKAESLTSQLSMPLDSALSLLRDKNNDIKLNLPVNGDTTNPDFDISGIINKAIGTAMKKASLTYLTHALQPYGSLITLAKLAKAAADHVSLNPILFTPASFELNDNAEEYTVKIASLLKDRPQLRIKLCGKATLLDSQKITQLNLEARKIKQAESNNDNDGNKENLVGLAPTDEQLLALASQRADAIKNILVNQHSIDASRLFLCKPQIDNEKEAKPRIDLTI